MTDLKPHDERVAAWMEHHAKKLTSPQLLQLFDEALRSLWERSHRTLADVTLLAIVDRVLHTSAARFPHLAALKVDAGGFRCEELELRGARVPAEEVARSIHFFLVEYLTVLGNLTAGILTPALHSELSRFDRARAAPEAAAASTSPRE